MTERGDNCPSFAKKSNDKGRTNETMKILDYYLDFFS